jgi:hypothetical protein
MVIATSIAAVVAKVTKRLVMIVFHNLFKPANVSANAFIPLSNFGLGTTGTLYPGEIPALRRSGGPAGDKL